MSRRSEEAGPGDVDGLEVEYVLAVKMAPERWEKYGK